jgi:glycosyltransferase involved in cell wall biosynthesis
MSLNIALIVATKDRPEELQKLLSSLAAQSCPVNQVIIVDGGWIPADRIIQRFPTLRTTYLTLSPPSAARQRNAGIGRVDSEVDLIGFLDDDVVLETGALEAMLSFWAKAPKNLGGAAFNHLNHPPVDMTRLQASKCSERLGLYGRRKGGVFRSGFQSMIGYVEHITYTQWLPSTAVVWRKEVIRVHRFDDWYSGYSYLEDLDLSYLVGKAFQLAVVPEALYRHYPASSGRGSGRIFGKREVLNRIHFVRKYQELSVWRCYLALMFRMLLNLSAGIKGRRTYDLKRAWGNILGLILSLRHA